MLKKKKLKKSDFLTPHNIIEDNTKISSVTIKLKIFCIIVSSLFSISSFVLLIDSINHKKPFNQYLLYCIEEI